MAYTDRKPTMKITMISNAMSHHQLPFCNAMAQMEDVAFHFIATKPLTDERKGMGYSDLNHTADYILRSYEDDNARKKAQNLAIESDFVIYGSAPYMLIKDRLRKDKWTFLYSERVFKRRKAFFFHFKLWLIYALRFGFYAGKRVKILCASAYAAQDFCRFGFRQKQCYRWGYFPLESKEDICSLLKKKQACTIIWVGRMIAWKHPEIALQLAYKLKKSDISFHLTMIGNGELLEAAKAQSKELGLHDSVSFTGALPTMDVRKEMARAEIMVTTSDQNEGWGAVINEAMSEGCAVCASREMGAAPFLIRDGENGFLYSSSDLETLYQRVKKLLEDAVLREHIARNAVQTIREEWNGANAARKLMELCRQLQAGNTSFAFPDGICSLADKKLSD